MSTAENKDWKLQVLDALDDFMRRADPEREASSTLLLEDEGQENLWQEAIRSIFPTSQFRRGDALCALELGRLFGHWQCLWKTLIISPVYSEILTASHAQAVELRDKIDSILAERKPEAIKGIETGLFHLLAAITDPAFIPKARENRRKFEGVCDSVMQFAGRQDAGERDEFLSGYREALASSPIDDRGVPKIPNILAMLLAFSRPFAVRAGLSAADFQEGIDQLANANITGNPERFSKHLQRRKASVRGKGRPAKKAGKDTGTKQKKSDNL
jgi:hypothetical protein